MAQTNYLICKSQISKTFSSILAIITVFIDPNSMTDKEYVAAETWTNKDGFMTFLKNNNIETKVHRAELKIEY